LTDQRERAWLAHRRWRPTALEDAHECAADVRMRYLKPFRRHGGERERIVAPLFR
jgi:hypothetical protein